FYSKMFIAHTGYLELFDLVVKHILPGMGLFFHFVLHFNCKFALNKKITYLTKGIDQVAAGNFAAHLDEQKGGPLSASYQNFNQMTDQLAKTATLRNDFINQFSHEFRTPIASIQGFADLMQERELPKKSGKPTWL
uniref:histidine kinase dimerization/phospho-acceptor domain-containing protein n=2 Tax=Limosilactobacillus fermentum TaxID=1613 RepID=UPI003BA250B5